MPLDPQARFLLDQLGARGGPSLHEMTPTEARAAFELLRVPIPGEAVDRIENLHVPSDGGRTIPVRLYGPAGSPPPAPGLVYFHGGGWVIGSPDTHENLCKALANRSGARVVSVDYRLAPEHPWPAAPEDGYAVACHLAEHGSEFGIDATRVAIAGDSAGGNLAAVVALMARDRAGPTLRHQALLYPVVDHDFDRPSYRENGDGYFLTRDDMRWFWDQYVADPALRSDGYVAPLHAEDLAGLPPATVITAEYDPLRDEGEAYAERLRLAGVPTTCTRYDGQIHGVASLLDLIDAGKRAVDQIGAALRSALA
ncbi:alpha/beta hydrolase [Myxococcota bacterium]|nr:alpha/beta hydrolase [Myxococcota bacterium]